VIFDQRFDFRLQHRRQELLSSVQETAAAADDKKASDDAASAVGEVAVELVAMMRRAGAKQRDNLQRKKAKAELKRLRQQYTQLVVDKASN